MIAYPLKPLHTEHWTFLNGHPFGKSPISVQTQICPSVGTIVRHEKSPYMLINSNVGRLNPHDWLAWLCCDYISMTIPWYPPGITWGYHGIYRGYSNNVCWSLTRPCHFFGAPGVSHRTARKKCGTGPSRQPWQPWVRGLSRPGCHWKWTQNRTWMDETSGSKQWTYCVDGPAKSCTSW
jgi:hypothetical protein